MVQSVVQSSTDIVTAAVPWRFTTPLHKAEHAQVFRRVVQVPAGQLIPILSCLYAPQTIDRVIGLRYRNLNATSCPDLVSQYGAQIAAANTMYFWEARGGSHYTVAAINRTYEWAFNVETLTDGINLQLESTLAHYAEISLFNFEIGATYVGN